MRNALLKEAGKGCLIAEKVTDYAKRHKEEL